MGEAAHDRGAFERGVVNDLGFRLFVRAARNGAEAVDSAQIVSEEASAVIAYLSKMRQFNRQPPRLPSDTGKAEAQAMAKRLISFFQGIGQDSPVCSPLFRGFVGAALDRARVRAGERVAA